MMGPRQEAQPALFYEFSLEDHVPQDHFLCSIDRFADLSSIRAHLADFYSHTVLHRGEEKTIEVTIGARAKQNA